MFEFLCLVPTSRGSWAEKRHSPGGTSNRGAEPPYWSFLRGGGFPRGRENRNPSPLENLWVLSIPGKYRNPRLTSHWADRDCYRRSARAIQRQISVYRLPHTLRIMIPPLHFDQKARRYQQSQQLSRRDSQPNAVHLQEDRQNQHRRHLKHQGP